MVQIGPQLIKWGLFHIFCLSYNLTSDDFWPWYMTFECMNIWRSPYYINKPSLVQSNFNFSNETTFTFSAYLWPWYVTFDLINKWGFPCCVYDPSLVEIHQRMWKLELNFNLFSQHQHNRQHQQTTTGDKVIPQTLIITQIIYLNHYPYPNIWTSEAYFINRKLVDLVWFQTSEPQCLNSEKQTKILIQHPITKL